jgi:hypothetical protein
MIGSGELHGGLYYLNSKTKAKTIPTCPSNSTINHIHCASDTYIPSSALWHFRLGHLSNKRLQHMKHDFPVVTVDNDSVCDICHLARHRKLPFVSSVNKATKCGELIHFDIWGPTSIVSVHGHKYFLTVVDDYSRFTWIILLKTKSEVSLLVQQFIVMLENQFNTVVKTVRTNNGPEFLIPKFYASKGIIHQTSCVETPQQNGRVERKHQHLLNVGRSLLFQSKLPKSYWSYAILHATFIINRVTTPLLQNKSPFHLLYNSPPDLEHLKVFGSLCFASTLHCHRTKLEPRARKCIFLGYKPGMKGVVLLDLKNRAIFVSRNVKHYDHILPYPTTADTVTWSYYSPHTPHTSYKVNSDPIQPPTITIHNMSDMDHSDPVNTPELLEPETSSPDDSLPTNPETSSPDNSLPTNPPSSSTTSPNPNDTTTTDTITDNSTNPTNTIEPVQLRRSTRISHRPSHLSDYIYNLPSGSSGSSSAGITYPISNFHSYSNVSTALEKFAMSIVACTEPKNYQEASQHKCWLEAMDAELTALNQNRTWIYVDKHAHITPIGNNWVYKVKHRADGSIERYKARLVAKGYNQIEGLDFFDTFSPVAKITTVRTLIALATIKSWFLHQMDVNNAFLHGELHEDVYMCVPQGVTSPKPNQVCKLLKSFYGLKQASRKWYERLTGLLVKQGYTQSSSDYSLFTLTNGDSFTALLVYVDDIILAGNSMEEFDRIKRIMHQEFKIKDLGQLRYFLGIEVAHASTGVTICQRKYCLDLLTDTGLLGSKPAPTPLDPSVKLHHEDSAAYDDIAGYRRLIGKLLYLTTTRPDIAFAVQQLSQFLSKPTIVHYDTACRVVRYLKGSPGKGLFFPRSSTLQILGFADADWANCIDTRRSTSGYCFFLGQSLISWRSKKQNTVSRSSTEAEYRALSFASCELQWLLFLLRDLNVTCFKPAVLYCDNHSAIHIASNPVFHERTKHLEIDCHFVRDKVQEGIFKLLPLSTKSQVADFFTKALSPKLFSSFLSKLSMVNIYHAAACGRLLQPSEEIDT